MRQIQNRRETNGFADRSSEITIKKKKNNRLFPNIISNAYKRFILNGITLLLVHYSNDMKFVRLHSMII